MQRLALVLLVGLLAGLVSPGPAPAAPTDGFTHFTGSLHTHTGYSDGVPGTTPEDAYARARDVEDLDFMAVTEHSEAYPVPMTLSGQCLEDPDAFLGCRMADEDPLNAADKWDAQRRQTTFATDLDEQFLALRGFEWTSDVHGHINVYFSRNYTTRAEGGEVSLEAFYEWLRTPAALGGGDDGLATFNHPGDKGVVDGDPRFNWNDFEYVEDLDDRIVGIEIYNRTKDRYEDEVIQALDAGWHLGVIGAEDIHDSNWGDTSYGRTTILADALTPAAFKEAMQNHRTYATLDNPVEISFAGAGEPMGSIVYADPDGTVPLHASVDGGDVARIDLLTNGGEIAATAEGRELTFDAPVRAAQVDDYYLLRVTSSDGRHSAYSSPIWVRVNTVTTICGYGPLPGDCETFGGHPAEFTPRWVAGDFHVHTTYSHDSYGGPHDHNTEAVECDEEPPLDPTDCDYDVITAGWAPGEQAAIAESRDLDFLTTTDHNNTFSVYDPAWSSSSLTLVPGYENSLSGHAQMIGAVSCYSTSGRTNVVEDCNRLLSGSDGDQVQALADAIRADGGIFQVNHPSDNDWLDTFGDGSGRPDGGLTIVPDSVEVWNIGHWEYQPPAPASNDNDFSLRFWETYLDAGYKVAATGGSDNHWRSTSWGQGVGQPTTWVYVTEPGVDGILKGIRAGRTSISHEPPGLAGPMLTAEVDTDGDGTFESMIGDTVPAGAEMRIRAENLKPGGFYRIVHSGGDEPILFPAGAEHITTVPDADWFYVELRHPDAREPRTELCDPLVGGYTTYCRNRLVMEAMTSAFYVS